MSLAGRFLDAQLRAPMAGYVPASPGEIKDYKQALEYGLAQHAGVKALAKSYPAGNWEAPAGYYFEAVDIAANRTSPLSIVVGLLSKGDAYSRAEVKRLGIGTAAPSPVFQAPPAQPTVAAPLPPAPPALRAPIAAPPITASSGPSGLAIGGLVLLAAIVAKKALSKGKKK